MPETRVVFRGPAAQFIKDLTPLIDLEGALNSGKTTACLWKLLAWCLDYPGIWCFLGRYTDGDTQNKIVPAWADICRQANVIPHWNGKEQYYEFGNGSHVYCFGLKAADSRAGRYAKLRGLGVSIIYLDQAEELPPDFLPELVQRMRQPGYPHQLVLSPNPLGENSWLAAEFPADQSRVGRKYYSLSLDDNAHNLPPETVAQNKAAYPPGHAKHRTMILGRRGLNVIGTPVYLGAFKRELHCRTAPWNPQLTLYEAVDFGKHNPCIVWCQFPLMGGIHFLGGILGNDLFLEDFAPMVQAMRQQWFPNPVEILTCCDPAGSHQNSQGVRDNGVQILRRLGWSPRWRENSNAPDVRLACVERLAGYMRRRTPTGEAFTIDTDPAHWIRVKPTGVTPFDFVADALEAGYVWDEHVVSVGSKQMQKPKKDGEYEHGMNCAEYLELNFGALMQTAAQREAETLKARNALPVLRPPTAMPFGTSYLG